MRNGSPIEITAKNPDTKAVPPPKTHGRIARVSMDAVRVIIYVRGKGVLLLRRSGRSRHFKGRLELPGGKIEADDPSVSYAAKLEVKEETGLDIALDEGSVYRWEKPPGQFLQYPNVHYRCDILLGFPLHPFQVDGVEGHIKRRQPRDHCEVLWVEPIGEILMELGPDLMEETREALMEYRHKYLPLDVHGCEDTT